MNPTEERRQQLEQRAEQIRFMGTQYALQGVEPPPTLQEEYERILADLEEVAPRR